MSGWALLQRTFLTPVLPTGSYRDIVFYFKFFLNPDIRRFPAKSSYSQRDAELQFRWVGPSGTQTRARCL